MAEKVFFTPKEAAPLYSTSEGHLANLRCQKRGPKFNKIGNKKILYNKSDLDAWVTENPVLTNE